VKEAATLDLLSDGRLEFGIGAGWSDHEYAAMGLTFDRPGARVDKLQEVVALFKAHCRGDDLDFPTARGYSGLPVTVQQPHPPVMIGGGRPRLLSFAAREADIVSLDNVPYDRVNADGLTPQEVASGRYELVRGAAGERLPHLDIEASPFFAEVTDDPTEAVSRIASMIGAPEEGFADHPNVLIGPADELVERLQERRERFGVNYVTVQQGALAAFAPVVEKLSGR
jgi:probable F420-dependent oxidoreductase